MWLCFAGLRSATVQLATEIVLYSRCAFGAFLVGVPDGILAAEVVKQLLILEDVRVCAAQSDFPHLPEIVP